MPTDQQDVIFDVCWRASDTPQEAAACIDRNSSGSAPTARARSTATVVTLFVLALGGYAAYRWYDKRGSTGRIGNPL